MILTLHPSFPIPSEIPPFQRYMMVISALEDLSGIKAMILGQESEEMGDGRLG
jgi:hypothetical protein